MAWNPRRTMMGRYVLVADYSPIKKVNDFVKRALLVPEECFITIHSDLWHDFCKANLIPFNEAKAPIPRFNPVATKNNTASQAVKICMELKHA